MAGFGFGTGIKLSDDWGFGLGRGVAPPVNSVAPSITGTTTEGSLLTVSPGTWSGSPSFTYQWTNSGVDISGATASTYTLVTADTARTINCRVTATNGGGSVSQLATGVAIPAPELVLNGTFIDGSNWGSPPSGWAFSAGTVNTTASAAFVGVSQAEDKFEAGVTYVVAFDISSFTSGSARIQFNNSGGAPATNGSNRASVGTFSQDFVAQAGQNQITIFAVAAGSTWAMDNLSVKKKVA